MATGPTSAGMAMAGAGTGLTGAHGMVRDIGSRTGHRITGGTRTGPGGITGVRRNHITNGRLWSPPLF